MITQWALDTYLELRSVNMFSREEYSSDIRPDVLKLRNYPSDIKFTQEKFWSPAQGLKNNGFKMKWHQVGNGKNQLRLTVGIFGADCFLCEAYIKKDDKHDLRQLARFKTILKNIELNQYTERGRL